MTELVSAIGWSAIVGGCFDLRRESLAQTQRWTVTTTSA